MSVRLNAPLFLVRLAGIYLVLALVYAYASPLFETPDEVYHFGFVHRIANTGRLPVQTPGSIGPWQQEGSQPPLYYLLAGTLVRPLPRPDFAQLRRENPHAVVGVTGTAGNKNRFLAASPYPPPLGDRPLADTALAAYTVRLFSIALGLVTVIAVYGCARAVVPGRPAVAMLAAALTALNPQFLFISASINNDTLVTALNSVALWQVAALVRDQRFDTRRSLTIAVVVALATLSKLSGLVVVPVAALAGLYVAYRSRDLRGLVVMGGLMLGVWLLLAGWWYARNLTLYGELFGSARMLDIFGRRVPPPLPDLLRELTSLVDSYWGVFGWFSILTVDPFYWFITALTLAGFGGWVLHLWRIRGDFAQGVRFFFIALAWVLGFISLLAWTLQTMGTQGRLLFPYIAAASTILAVGLLECADRLSISARWPAGVALLTVVPLGVFAALIPFITLIPTYRPPAPLAALPASATPFAGGVYYTPDQPDPVIQLAAYEITPRVYAPGDTVPLTLYWRPLLSVEADYSLFVHVIAEQDNIIIGQVDSYPGYGSLATSRWLPHEAQGAPPFYPERLRIRIDPRLAAGLSETRLVAHIGWWYVPTGARLTTRPQPVTGEDWGVYVLPLGTLSDGAAVR